MTVANSCRLRNELKSEKIDPSASGAINGYISLCAGDPCPPVFSSPVEGMDDIIDNQVICAIYKVPDYHKHISRPPAGVKLPKKTVTLDDIQPDPTLWHDDTGRRPWHNDRPHNNHNHNPHGAASSRHLGDAAHRLVTNSLQVKPDRNGHHQSYDPHPRGPPPRSYGQSHGSSTHYGRSNSQAHGYYLNQHAHPPPRGPHQSQHLPASGQYYPQQGGGYAYNSAASHHHHHQQSGGRGQGRPQQGGGNQFSGLSRDGRGRSHQPYRRKTTW